MYSTYIDIIVYLFYQFKGMLSSTIKYRSNNFLNRHDHDLKGLMRMCCCC